MLQIPTDQMQTEMCTLGNNSKQNFRTQPEPGNANC